MKITFIIPAILISLCLSCGSAFKDGYDLEVDQAYDGLELASYIQEGSGLQGTGEAIEGLMKIKSADLSGRMIPSLYALAPEDSFIKVNTEDRYSNGRLSSLEIEIRFPEATKVKKMTILEDFQYSTDEKSSQGDLNTTKPPSDGGPFALVEVDYRNIVGFEKFSSKVVGNRRYNEDPSLKDYFFRDKTYGIQTRVKDILTQATFSQGLGLFSRVLTLSGGEIATFVKSFTKDEAGSITGTLSGDLSAGVILQGDFNINTVNTLCLLDDTGTLSYKLTYPAGDGSGKKTETFDVELLENGVSNINATLDNADGSTKTKSLHRVITRPATCDERLIRQTAVITGTDYDGGSVDLSETKVQKFTHVYGTIKNVDDSTTKVDIYRVSGQAIYR